VGRALEPVFPIGASAALLRNVQQVPVGLTIRSRVQQLRSVIGRCAFVHPWRSLCPTNPPLDPTDTPAADTASNEHTSGLGPVLREQAGKLADRSKEAGVDTAHAVVKAAGNPEPLSPPEPISLQSEPAKPDPKSVELLFWDSIKGSVHPADYEAYLDQYPDGDFASLARARLDEYTDIAGRPRDPTDREVELSFWEAARKNDSLESLQAYLDKYPTGQFRSFAEIRIRELNEPPAAKGTREPSPHD
jgi:hypothetical protein